MRLNFTTRAIPIRAVNSEKRKLMLTFLAELYKVKKPS